MSNYLKRIADSKGAFANLLRKRRFTIFLDLLNPSGLRDSNKKLKLLDVGGTTYFWKAMDFLDREDIKITILNLFKEDCIYRNVITVVGDACDMKQFKDKEFDVVYSNSVIEHVGFFENQKRMAGEVQRVGEYFFIQTPNFFFPLEPHFLIFGFQFLPTKLKAWLLRHFNIGWYKKIKDYNKSLEVADSIRLLKRNELISLFPESSIEKEKLLGFTKSFMVHNFPKK